MDFIPVTKKEEEIMLKDIGVESVGELFDIAIPDKVRMRKPLNIPHGVSEYELAKELNSIAAENASLDRYISFLGGGAYDHYIPKIVDAVTSLPELYTAYTPYQPEVSQGVLQSLFEYQTMICELTGFDVANASLYDGSTAVSEAALLAQHATGKNEIVISQAVHPEYKEVLRNYTRGLGMTIKTVPAKDGQTDVSLLEDYISEDSACIILQQPNFFGYLEDVNAVGEIAGRYPALFIVCVDPVSLGILKAPADYGADIAVGEGQPLGNRINFGGPYLGIFACKREYLRRVPGHLISLAHDKKDRTGFVLTLQTREQHIRRERATSNICTSEALNAIAAAAHMSCLGPSGIRETAVHCLQKAHYAHEALQGISYLESLSEAPFFKEFAFKSSVPISEINRHLFAEGIIGPLDIGRLNNEYANTALFCVTEKRTKEEIDTLVQTMRSI